MPNHSGEPAQRGTFCGPNKKKFDNIYLVLVHVKEKSIRNKRFKTDYILGRAAGRCSHRDFGIFRRLAQARAGHPG
jgi:hypothetical protein